MDKTTTGNMKEEAVFQFQLQKEQVRYDAPVMLQAIQAYAALCQAEEMERIADAMQSANSYGLPSKESMNLAADAMNAAADMQPLNRTDQSIADAISEQVTDPPDVLTFPWENGAFWYCVCAKSYQTEGEAMICAGSH